MADRLVNSQSSRSVVQAYNGMVATSQPLAAANGLKVLMEGGNAVDAAVAIAAVLCVVEPFSTGIGGDMFALVYEASSKELVGLNGSGRSPYNASTETMRAAGYTTMPERGVNTITVPGTVDGWASLLKRFGTKTLKELLQPAIMYAREGYPVSEIISAQWQRAAYALMPYQNSKTNYLLKGRAPCSGELFRQPDLADTLEKIAEGGRDVFYQGDIAKEIITFCNKYGGIFIPQDFAEHSSEWVEPISTNYHGFEVFELPPNGQGLCVLQMLNILEGYNMQGLGHNSADYLHLIIEAKKLAFAHRNKYIGDPSFNYLPIEELLSKNYAAKLRKKISMDRALESGDHGLKSTDTVILSVVDREGNCVSFINSIFRPFGSGMVAAGTGIILQNRGSSFSLEDNHFNRLEPHKLPFHTLIPAMVFKDDRPVLCFGVMGGDMQPQGHAQVLLNMIHFGMNVQEAGEAPRVCHMKEGVALEYEVGTKVRNLLMEKGHKIIHAIDVFGGYQGIYINPETGVIQGGSDPRKDGCALGY